MSPIHAYRLGPGDPQRAAEIVHTTGMPSQVERQEKRPINGRTPNLGKPSISFSANCDVAHWCVLLYVLLRSGRRSLSSALPCAPQRNAQPRIGAQRRVWPGVRARAATRCGEVRASEPAIPHRGAIGLIVVFATEKCDVFAGNPASNLRVVGVYLGTPRMCLQPSVMRHRNARSMWVCYRLCRRGLEGDGH